MHVLPLFYISTKLHQMAFGMKSNVIWDSVVKGAMSDVRQCTTSGCIGFITDDAQRSTEYGELIYVVVGAKRSLNLEEKVLYLIRLKHVIRSNIRWDASWRICLYRLTSGLSGMGGGRIQHSY